MLKYWLNTNTHLNAVMKATQYDTLSSASKTCVTRCRQMQSAVVIGSGVDGLWVGAAGGSFNGRWLIWCTVQYFNGAGTAGGSVGR